MDASDVRGLLELFELNGLDVYVDGGWAVDALLGTQTRAHGDLDIAIPEADVPRMREILGERGYREVKKEDSWECNFVLADALGREVDVHSYTLDEAGNNVHGVAYRGEHLKGKGKIGGYAVRCIAPEWLVRFHTGYDIDEDDFRDVRVLCERFGIALPEEYRKFSLLRR